MAKKVVSLLMVSLLCILATVSTAKDTKGSASPALSASPSLAKKVPPPSPSPSPTRKNATPPSATDGATVSGPTSSAASPSESTVLPPTPSSSIDASTDTLSPAFAPRPHNAAAPSSNSAMWGFAVTVIASMLTLIA